jgi:hypothetical protein
MEYIRFSPQIVHIAERRFENYRVRQLGCPMLLIPTALKEKLPKGFSYPLGAEAIGSALDGSPQIGNGKLWFHWRDEFWASRWRKRLASRGLITLFQVNYSEHLGYWSFRVYSVPSQCTVVAREHLLAELVQVRGKLMAAGSEAKSLNVAVTLSLADAERAAKARMSLATGTHH